ncbi:Unknown protein [Striga hermonthica]|uniref:Integrase catalytic domain-containing protein n=1 Tax=Striga hermonthica TaxID=68872 RepID=A0A9N7N208_STRHE|nr:Unknown protein [Striga hermonthica]
MEVESLGGSRYFVTFTDDASRKLWVYFLRTKGEVFQYFKRFHAMVERQAGKPLKCLRSDNGGEYTSHEFKNYCAEHGIRHEKTVPGTPQHNGVAERINRTIMDKVSPCRGDQPHRRASGTVHRPVKHNAAQREPSCGDTRRDLTNSEGAPSVASAKPVAPAPANSLRL